MSKYGCIAVTLGLVMFFSLSAVCSESVYDVDGDGKEGLVEAVHALQAVSDLHPPLTSGSVYDVDGDGTEGLFEVVHALQVVSGLHPPLTQLESYINSINMRFNLIPAGTFTMGSPEDEPQHLDRETQHEVTLTAPFYVLTTEVTNENWNVLIVDNNLGVNPSASHTEGDYPVENINWFEAAFFANTLSESENRTACYSMLDCSARPGEDMECSSVEIIDTCTGYRLPTEAQWEYAARATTTTAYANRYDFDSSSIMMGSGLNSNLDAMGWYTYNAEAPYESGTKPVGVKQANFWGLYDMHGNVWEWCQDRWDGSESSSASVTDPIGAPSGSSRIIRGGAWSYLAMSARSANRNWRTPGYRVNNIGFRVVLPPGQ